MVIRKLSFLLILFFPLIGFTQNNGTWNSLGPYDSDPVVPFQRHENAFIEYNNKMYLLGGRTNVETNIYDPLTNTWTVGTTRPPSRVHHFQPVVYNDLIYIIGAQTGGFPTEPGIPNIMIYDPNADTWTTGPAIPPSRVRGSTGVVVYNDKIYVICGIINGHQSGHVAWFDEYDPATDTWTQLPDAPRARDHFQAIIHEDKLIVSGGRRSKHANGGLNSDMVREIDIYDFNTGTWSSLTGADRLPTQRAGTMSLLFGSELLVIGGESNTQSDAHDEVEALDLNTFTWRDYPPLVRERHGTGVVLYDGKIFLATGSEERGNLEIPASDPYYMEVYTPDNIIPTAAFTATPTSGNAPLGVNFDASGSTDSDGSIASYSWDFGDGNNGTGITPSHTFTSGGTFTVTLTVTDNLGATDIETTNIQVNGTGVTSYTAWLEGECATVGSSWVTGTDAAASEGEFVVYNGTNSLGSAPTAASEHVSFEFTTTEAGIYEVWARVKSPTTDDDSYWVRMNGGTWVKWNEIGPFTDFTWSQVHDSDNGKALVTYNLGAGTHTLDIAYRENGTQLDKVYIFLNAPDPSGTGGTSSNCANQAPTASYTASPNSGLSPLTVNFDASGSSDSDGSIASYSWDFGDGNSGTGATPTHTFTGIGTFTVTLTVTDNEGATGQSISDIQVSDPTAAQILFVSENTTEDQIIRTRLTNAGYIVTDVTGTNSRTEDAVGKSLVIVSSTVSSGQVNTKFTNVSVPVLTNEGAIFDDMGMTSNAGTDLGTTNTDEVVITNSSHPMAAGLSGTIQVTTSPSPKTWGKPNANAITVGVTSTDNTREMIFGYESGASMVSGVAPARRVGFFLHDTSPSLFTNDGWALFDAAVIWALGAEATLPVDWAGFEATQQDQTVLLNWSTFTEQNTDRFIIERATDARLFLAMDSVKAAGNSNRLQNYQFRDLNPELGSNVYRLKQVDLDGSFSYSPLMEVYVNAQRMEVFPNPLGSTESVKLNWQSGQQGIMQIHLHNLLGQSVYQQHFMVEADEQQRILTFGSLSPGIYLLNVSLGTMQLSKRLIVRP